MTIVTNCQPVLHDLPDGAAFTLVGGRSGDSYTCDCGAVTPRPHDTPCVLLDHVTRPSGTYRLFLMVNPATCSACGFEMRYGIIPCGDDPLAQLFQPAQIALPTTSK
jgi:hypothetical protein